MSTLDIAIATVAEKIKKFRSLYEQNEMAVRDHIVNPILRSLGWDPENPEEVQPNISIEEGVPDYLLLKDGKKMLLIEAKKLGIDVEQPGTMR
jgi:predicted type IV restriction endonuclease